MRKKQINEENGRTNSRKRISVFEERNDVNDLYVPIWKKYCLTIDEAAVYFGIGRTRLYKIITEHPDADFVLEIGSHVKVKREAFSRFLDSTYSI